MFAHAIYLLCPALHVEVKRKETGWEQRFTSQFDRELGGFREFQVTVQEAFSKKWGFVRNVEVAIFPWPGVGVLEDPLTHRQVSISRQGGWVIDTVLARGILAIIRLQKQILKFLSTVLPLTAPEQHFPKNHFPKNHLPEGRSYSHLQLFLCSHTAGEQLRYFFLNFSLCSTQLISLGPQQWREIKLLWDGRGCCVL